MPDLEPSSARSRKNAMIQEEEEESIEINGAVKLMDGMFLSDAPCAEVINIYPS